jgi:pimeloyl-ACP methyl ester carboxylesterase
LNPSDTSVVHVSGLAVRYAASGQGRPVVLLHGNGGFLEDYLLSGSLAAVARDFRAVAFDRPGHGHSERLPGRDAGSPAAQAAHLRAAAAALGLERPIVVGHSWSGCAALAWALDAPDETAAVVTLEGTFYEETRLMEPVYPWMGRPLFGPILMRTAVPLIADSRMKRRLLAAFHPDPIPDWYLQAASAFFLRASALSATAEDAVVRAREVADLSHRYPTLAVPLEIVASESDTYVPSEAHSHRLHREIPGSVLTVLPGAGHQVPQARPEAVVEAVRRAAARSRA